MIVSEIHVMTFFSIYNHHVFTKPVSNQITLLTLSIVMPIAYKALLPV